jgi:hypothetical protein
MTALGTLALTSGEVAFFTPPPNRPRRPDRRTKRDTGITRSLMRVVRNGLAQAKRANR